jgi:tricorn protease
LPDKLAIPYAELGSFSPNGDDLAYVTRITENYPFKRYRGGFASDIYVYNLKLNIVENITQNPATDGKPAWVKNKIFYVSDNDKHQRRNIWVYDVAKKTRQEITNFDKDDINYMSSGGGEVIFEAAGKLYVLNADTYKYEEVKISTTNDISTLMARTVNVANYVQNADISPDGKRAVIEARGELFNVPAEQGFVLNLTSSSGSFERNPSWSPDGKYIAYWSDASGENELYIRESTAGAAPKKLTSFGKGYGWKLYWSPDSKKIAFIDFEQAIRILTVATGASIVIDHTKTITFSGFSGFTLSWSPDNKWLAYSKSIANNNDAIFFYNTESNKVEQVTSGYYNDTRPVFDPGGNIYIF